MQKGKSVKLSDLLSSEGRPNERKLFFRHFMVTLGIISLLFVLLTVLFVIQIDSEKNISRNLALKEVVSIYNHDLNFRLWATSHGGFYVPVTEELEPNPYLVNVPEQNIVTESGIKLTLMNPAWALRALDEFKQQANDNRSHITSLNLLRPENLPDNWEIKALKSFKNGVGEVSQISDINGEPFFRFMKPLITEEGCLKCHLEQGYAVGDIRGGISVSVPFSPYLEIENRIVKKQGVILSIIFFIGLICILLSSKILRKRKFEIIQTRNLLIESYASLKNEVANSERINAKLKLEILKHEKAEVRLRNLDAAIEQSPVSIVITNLKGEIEYVNKYTCKISGYTKEELMGNNPRILQSGEMNKGIYLKMWEDISAGLEWRGRFHNKKKNGDLYWEDALIAPIYSENGAISHYLAVKEDITERISIEEEKEKLQSQLNQKNKMDGLGQLAGGIAHDFNNIVNGIFSSAQLLQMPERGLDDKALKYVNIINQASLRASDLTKKLLTYSRRDQYSFKSVDIHEIINETVDILGNTINKKIDIVVEKHAERVIISGDKSELENSLINLVLNACQAMSYSGQIFIRTKNININQKVCDLNLFDISPGEYIKIEVTDTGCGIPEDKVDKIFEPFFTTKEPGEGTGLGLTAVYSSVKNHKGTILVESIPGQGTSISITFPCVMDHHENKKTAGRIISGSGLVLLVDDEETNRIIGAEIIESLGYQVLLAENGYEALKIFKQNISTIGVILLDMIMPVMDGRETFQKLREIDENCKIVISSGYTKNESIDEMMSSGLSGFIKKPYKISELSGILKLILNTQ